MLYKTGVEYLSEPGDFCMNHVEGCSHGCNFPCYAYLMNKRFGKSKNMEEWCEPKLVSNTMELLEKEIPKYKDEIKRVHLCFSTDPFMYKQLDVRKMSLNVIKCLNDSGIKCSVLTKGIIPSELTLFDKYSKDNELGITLVSLDEDFRREYEPGTPPYKDRIEALKFLHDKGCKTWVSIEPYMTPNIVKQEILPILEEISFVDKIVFGRGHYNPKITEYLKLHPSYYLEMADIIISYCEHNNIEYHMKKGTI